MCFVWMCILFGCDISWEWMCGMDVGEGVLFGCEIYLDVMDLLRRYGCGGERGKEC